MMDMRLSESLRRGTMKAGAGGIINRFKARKRRDVLFFEDILARYIKECEEAGYGRDMEEIGRKWMNLVITNLFPRAVIRMPIRILLPIAKSIWTNLGLIDDVKVERNGEMVKICTKNEYITRIIGRNRFSSGFFAGILDVMFSADVEVISSSQTKGESEYIFRPVKGSKTRLQSKSKDIYNSLNEIVPANRPAIKHAMIKKMFRIEGNMLKFRGRLISPIENTLFHLMGADMILPARLSEISREYFDSLLYERASEVEKIRLMKNIFQAMGWGAISISTGNGGVTVEVDRPPIGLQEGGDNWNFLALCMLGYLQAVYSRIGINRVRYANRKLTIRFSNRMNRAANLFPGRR